MYTALGIMLLGIIMGKFLPNLIPSHVIQKSISGAIFLLLFLLGASIGSNPELMKRLPDIGLDALLLMLFCVGGSMLFAWLLTRKIH